MGDDIPYRDGGFAQFGPLTGVDIALQFALDSHSLSVDVGFYLPVGANRQVVAAQFDGAFDLSVDVEVFTAGQFTLDDDRLADVGEFAGFWCIHEMGLPNLGYR